MSITWSAACCSVSINRNYLRGCPSGPVYLGSNSHRSRESLENHSTRRSVKLRNTSTEIRGLAVKSSWLARVEGQEEGEPLVGNGDGIIIVDHGSWRGDFNRMLNEFVAMFRQRTGYTIVEPAHVEEAEPSVKDAFDLCVQQGASRIIVSPFFIYPDAEWYKGIPILTAKAAKAHPGVSYIVTAPLGLHELLVDVMNERIEHCLNHAAGLPYECAACAGTDRCGFYRVKNSVTDGD